MSILGRRFTVRPWYVALLCVWVFVAPLLTWCYSGWCFADAPGEPPYAEQIRYAAYHTIAGLAAPTLSGLLVFVVLWSPILTLPFGLTEPVSAGE